jgi:hypothetical protein
MYVIVCMYDVCMYLCMYVCRIVVFAAKTAVSRGPRTRMTRVCMYVYAYVCMYVCMYLGDKGLERHVYVCMMYVCMYVCMYVSRDPRNKGHMYVCKYART